MLLASGEARGAAQHPTAYMMAPSRETDPAPDVSGALAAKPGSKLKQPSPFSKWSPQEAHLWL